MRIELLMNLGFGIACVDLGNNNIDGGTTVAYVEEGEGGGGCTITKEEKKLWFVLCPNVMQYRQGKGILQLRFLLRRQPNAHH